MRFILLISLYTPLLWSEPLSKLDLQFGRYLRARELVLQRAQRVDLPLEQRLISREQWEEMIGALAFSAQEIEALRLQQQRRILASRQASLARSSIDLQRVRVEQRVADFCQRTPKGGMLHVHPFGTLDRGGAKQLLRANNPLLNVEDIFADIGRANGNVSLATPERNWLSGLPGSAHYLALNDFDRQHFTNMLFLPPGKQSFPRFNAVFEFLKFAISDWDSFSEVMHRFARKAAADGVSYVEFTSLTNERMDPTLAAIEHETGLKIRVNYSFVRTQTVAEIDQEWQKVLALAPSKYLVGIDLLDNEDGNPALEKGQLVYAAAALKGWHRTMHAGEIGDRRNPRDAMILGAERLGHGVNLIQDPVALEYAIRQHEAVEVNLSSNLRLTDVASVGSHPFLLYLRLGLPVSLSTDDEGIFDTDIINECRLAVADTDLNYAEWKQMAMNSIETSFASEADKVQLLRDLQDRFTAFERSWH